MPLDGFEGLHADADLRESPATIAVVGGDDPTVLAALCDARDRRWIKPILVGPERATRALAAALAISLDEFTFVDVETSAAAEIAVAEVRAGNALALMKGRISTPMLMAAILDPETGLRSGRVVAQIVLMEIPRDNRRFLLADTGITIKPDFRKRVQILKYAIEVARALGAANPLAALMSATETVNLAMPETIDAAEITLRGQQGEFPGCTIQGPLSFDLAYNADAGVRKSIGGDVVGAADIMIFPDLLSANLTVKAIMYTADCQFGGVLRGTSAPVVFMSRADNTETRLNSLALTLRILDDEGRR